MTALDVAALAVVALAALLSLRRGLVGSVLSAAGIVAGAILGARVAPDLLFGGEDSPYTPLAALAGALVGAVLLETLGTLVAAPLRRSLRLSPLVVLDAAGGFLAGAAAGLAIVWVLGAVALHLPDRTELRRGVQRSLVLRRLNALVPPARLIEAIERVDPFPAIAGPAPPLEPPDPRLLRRPGVRAAAPSVLRVLGTSCGLAVSGSGWVAGRGLVVTAAHVVAGQRDTEVEGVHTERLDAEAVAFDVRNDVAVLRVEGLRARPLRLGDADPGDAVVILGFPEGGGLSATPGRVGRTATVVTRDARGRGPVVRTVTALRGRVRHGNSGGPAVNASGEVEATVFAARIGSSGGFGVPSEAVLRALRSARGPVSTGPCAS